MRRPSGGPAGGVVRPPPRRRPPRPGGPAAQGAGEFRSDRLLPLPGRRPPPGGPGPHPLPQGPAGRPRRHPGGPPAKSPAPAPRRAGGGLLALSGLSPGGPGAADPLAGDAAGAAAPHGGRPRRPGRLAGGAGGPLPARRFLPPPVLDAGGGAARGALRRKELPGAAHRRPAHPGRPRPAAPPGRRARVLAGRGLPSCPPGADGGAAPDLPQPPACLRAGLDPLPVDGRGLAAPVPGGRGLGGRRPCPLTAGGALQAAHLHPPAQWQSAGRPAGPGPAPRRGGGRGAVPARL